MGFMALLVLGLAGLSLRWPIIGDAAMFHFAAAQFMGGAVPYRDFIDMNMPLVYVVHAAVIALGGLGDAPFRAFDLAAIAAIGLLAALLVRPRGTPAAVLAALSLVAAHLLFGPSSAGERDALLLGPMLLAALWSCEAAERPDGRWPRLFGAGLAAGAAVLLKPTAGLLVVLPFLALRPSLPRLAVVLAGAALPLLAALGVLLRLGALPSFLEGLRVFTPYYAALATRPWPVLLAVAAKQAVLGAGGLALAALLGWRTFRGPRARVLVGLVGFGLLHILVQRKGFFYHGYPLVAGVVCLGAWTLPGLPRRSLQAVCLASVLVFGLRGVQAARLSLGSADQMMPTPATAAMAEALASRLPRGARVQMLDMSGGAYLAMARTGMRQATPFAYWLYLDPGEPAWRATFIQAMRDRRPDAVLVTDNDWPANLGLAAVDRWPEFQALLTRCYRRVEDRVASGSPTLWMASSPSVAWRLYLPVPGVPDGC